MNTFHFLFLIKMLVIRAVIHKKIMSEYGRPTGDCFLRSSLIWVCTVCLDLYYSQLTYHMCSKASFIYGSSRVQIVCKYVGMGGGGGGGGEGLIIPIAFLV